MRLARFDNGRTGVLLDDDTIVDVSDQLSHGGWDWSELIERWDELGPQLERAAAVGERRALADVRLGAPMPSPAARIFAMGANFRSHIADAAKALKVDDLSKDATRPPAGFFVIPHTIGGHEDDVLWPADAQRLDYEAEVAVVLATGGRDLAEEDVRFWGYSAFNDLSIRDPHLKLSRLDEGSLSWALQKNFQNGNVLGPWLVVDPDASVDDISIKSSVNGELRQDGSTSQMIRSFTEGAAYLSQYLDLRPGDMLTSGTPGGTAMEQGPDGPFLQVGDVIEIDVGGVGLLRNRIAARN